MSKPGFMVGKWPAVVASYDKASRECRVQIPGLTDGGNEALLAEIEYPVGDKSKAGTNSTDILMLPGDDVWVEFLAGDPRYPIITGQRNPQTGNGTDWRRWHQANIELLAVQVMNLMAGGIITIKSDAKINLIAPLTHVQGPLLVDQLITGTGGMAVSGGSGAAIEGDLAVNGGNITNNGANTGSTHTHTELGDGAEVSPPH